MSGKTKRSLMQNLERGFKRIKVFSSSSGDPGPSNQSTQQVDTPLIPGTGTEPMPERLGFPPLPPAAPPSNTEPNDNIPNPPPASTSSAPPTTKPSAKHERWAELKSLANILGKGFNSFGPLKQAVDGIVAGIDIFETAAQNRVDYENLRNDLNAMFHDLAEFFDASTPPVMVPAIINFAQGIDRELEMVRLRLSETRTGTHATDADKILEHYRRIQALVQRLTSNVDLKILQGLEEQAKVAKERGMESRLMTLPHSPAAKYSSAESSDLRGGCTEDTRVDLLEDIYEWACNDKSQKIYWLNGMAGTGKTTIAYSFCERLERSEKLAASFFCSRQLLSCRDVNRIVPTMSYQLSRFSRPFWSAISEVLEKKPDAYNQVLLNQLKDLLIEPLDSIKETLPTDLVVVIDALDECDNSDGVDRMLSALLSSVRQLPVKFFVASRPDANILDHMRSRYSESMPTELRLHELGRSIVQGDIQQYLTVRLMPRMKLSAGDLKLLVERSGVLFIYASTVVRYIRYNNFSRASSRLKQILELTKDSSSDSEKEINVLYSVILSTALNDSNLTDQEREEVKLVLHTVVCAPERLSVDVMAGLLGLNAEAVWAALRSLFSVLHVLDTTHIITTLHQSFPDYLLNSNRSRVFYCDSKMHNTWLAQRCFEHMRSPNPPFNICNLESSYVFDEDVPDLPARCKKAISKQLLYACRYWVTHLMSARPSQDLIDMLHEFISERFLLWIEVMNLSGNIKEGVSRLKQAQKWSLDTIHLIDDGIRRFLVDMWMFADSFASSGVRLSTPHIYVSMLTFWPDHSPIRDHYGQQQTRLIAEQSTAMSLRWTNPVGTPDFGGLIHCVSYSPNGAYIVSSESDGNIYIWNAHTGQPVEQRLQGHAHGVKSVVYSPNGARIVSGSYDNTIRIWDAHTGRSIGQPLKGHTGFVYSVTHSPDGAYIASGSWDNTVRVWDTYTGQPVGRPLKGHTEHVESVAYSPDGAYVVSGSWDHTIRIWDAHTHHPVGQPLIGHHSSIHSVAYSPDGAYIASGSRDCTIRIWDAYTHQPFGQPMEGHAHPVNCVTYSPDGAYIVSGSDDHTIRIWDSYTGHPVGQPLEGHTDCVNSIAYSPDGAYLVSGSYDRAIRIWDMKIVLLMDHTLEVDHRRSQSLHSLHAIYEPRILFNLGCQITCPHMNLASHDNGWVVFNDNKLIWVPSDLHEILIHPKNTALISTRGVLRLDLDHDKLGEHWHEYFQPGRLLNDD